MKKKILAMLLTLAMLTPTLAACGNTVPEETDSDTGIETPEATESETESETEEETEPVMPEVVIGSEETPGALTLFKNGTSEYVIVRGENATEQEILASTELQSYLFKITGTELPIVTDDTPAVKKEIVVGKTNRETDGQFDRTELINDGFIIQTESDKLWLIGGNEYGTLYAVYELLEAYLDCRFYTSDFERVTNSKNIFLQIDEDKQIPYFETRNIFWADMLNNSTLQNKVKMRVAGAWAADMCHTIPILAETGGGGDRDPCLLDPVIYDTVLKNVRAKLAANPGARYISVSQSDNIPCQCEACAASAKELGWSGHYLTFVNRIAEEIADEYPDVLVHTFAYQHTKEPPKTDIVPADNVMIQFCTIEACFSHPLTEKCSCGEYGPKEDQEEEGNTLDWVAMLEEWTAICDNMAVWDYTANFGNFNALHPNFHVLQENIQFFVEHNVVYLFEQGAYQTLCGEFAELRAYLLARLAWDPYMSEEKYYSYMDEFLCDYYGPGWEYIREYIDAGTEAVHGVFRGIWSNPAKAFPCEELAAVINTPSVSGLTGEDLRNFVVTDWIEQYYPWLATETITPHPVLALGMENFEKAMEMAETAKQKAHLEKSALQFECMYLKNYEQLLENPEKYLYNLFANAVSDAYKAGELEVGEIATLQVSFQKKLEKELTPILKTLTKNYNKLYGALRQKLLSYGISHLSETENIRGVKT